MRKIKKGDEIIVLSGKDKGQRGQVIKIINDRVLVENLNMVKRHTKANPAKNTQGGILDKEMPMHISNVAHFNPVSNKADRVGVRTLDDGRRVRYYKSTGEVLEADA